MTIDNTNLLQMCRDCGATGFVPAVDYAYDSGAATVTLNNASTIPAGDTFSKMKARVHDFFGNEVRGVQTVQATDLVLDVSTLDRSKPLAITLTIHTTNKIAADGSASGYLETAGDIGHWDVQKNA